MTDMYAVNMCNTVEPGAWSGSAWPPASGPAARLPAGDAGISSTTSSTSVGLSADKV